MPWASTYLAHPGGFLCPVAPAAPWELEQGRLAKQLICTVQYSTAGQRAKHHINTKYRVQHTYSILPIIVAVRRCEAWSSTVLPYSIHILIAVFLSGPGCGTVRDNLDQAP